MKVMIMAGGTGGHIFPAAAVAEQFASEGWDVRWLGSQRGMEGKLVPQMGFEFCGLPVTAWHGGKLRKLMAPINLLRALWHSFWLMNAEKPDAVIGFGGYASAPGGIAAWLQKRPLILHEQNGVPGLTNAKLAKRADCVLQAFPNTFAQDYEVVGNPVRGELCNISRPIDRNVAAGRTLKVLVLGGSQGAQAINALVPDAISQMVDHKNIEVWHQTGAGKANDTAEIYRTKKIEATVVEFIDDMTTAYSWADLVVARSGASTVSELAAVGLYSILLPYPWHIDKQQYRNAQWLADQDAAVWYEQNDYKAEQLAKDLTFWQHNREQLKEKAEQAWKMGIRDSAKRIFNIVNNLVVRKTA